MTPRHRALMPGLDRIAFLVNTLDTETLTAEEIRSITYRECMAPTLFDRGHAEEVDRSQGPEAQ